MTLTAEGIIIIALLFLVAILLIILLAKQGSMARNLDVDIDQDIDEIAEDIARLSGAFDADRKLNAQMNSQMRDTLEGSLRSGMKTQYSALQDMSDKQMSKLSEMSETQERSLRFLMQENSRMKEELTRSVRENLGEIEAAMNERLDRIQGVVGEKLDKTLNERLESNFKQVGEQLANLYRSLGELKDLSSGVQDLNRTLTNVKTRGTFGEIQLERILEQTLTPSQYDRNVATKRNSSDRVEFAVKIPGLEGGDVVYLPIDSKFPSDIYNTITDAASASDAAALSKATGELRRRILDESRTIRDKYLDPPATSNFAILFLPTEGLYSEVLRINGLTEECQKNGVIVAGPTTITAVLNSLQAGFRNIQLSKKSVEIMKLLEAIKAQFARMDEEVAKTQKKLAEAAQATDQLSHRTKIIQSRMRKIGEADLAEADELLGLEE